MTTTHAKRSLGLDRRAALQVGAGLFGLSLPGMLQAAQTASANIAYTLNQS